MLYSDFTIPELKKKSGLILEEQSNLVEHVAEVEIPSTLTDTLQRYLPLALDLNTEKARSELVIAPVQTHCPGLNLP